ncbi:DUF5818 domain-containing protein [Sphingomonas solaris]|uniref:Uncharacterized protein n=1 Tax=Alterirhizorhabdus solaris TaxID=2529389 RepID=A0A558R3T2_9SPHN|nr:DUF5818 domain-containing protein [Sphingomonas solaris]TVV74040.1 hypothetical protein FOY91_10795 [Sphingomonas solaris]
MADSAVPHLLPAARVRPCRVVGRFVDKDNCFALRDRGGTEIWLEMEQIPLHLLDQDVEVSGRRYGTDLIWVEAIGPVPTRS